MRDHPLWSVLRWSRIAEISETVEQHGPQPVGRRFRALMSLGLAGRGAKRSPPHVQNVLSDLLVQSTFWQLGHVICDCVDKLISRLPTPAPGGGRGVDNSEGAARRVGGTTPLLKGLGRVRVAGRSLAQARARHAVERRATHRVPNALEPNALEPHALSRMPESLTP